MTARPLPRSLPRPPLCLAALSPEAPASPQPAGSGAGSAIPDGELSEACTQVDFARDGLYTPAEDRDGLARLYLFESGVLPEGRARMPELALGRVLNVVDDPVRGRAAVDHVAAVALRGPPVHPSRSRRAASGSSRPGRARGSA
jgi:hypothetical protein